ncbi:hypothetical protein SAMN02745165_02844 [Malonomonas rubra DSM 5091]|uniref:Uncharacterized protein n=1 Tax=Malonomonas rubra DSM 5091 TaxID=1122189 RepID=A0A1M6KYB9_MALRU|nr:hypothetical protein [Malonomonas rubra]SHJ63993.1 hypothetical protein SAMN02745165_02844 [Malonomonas rubra DSM 5091]
MQYSKVLVHAFSVATGRSIAEGLIELGLSDVVQEEDVKQLTAVEENYLQELLSDEDSIRSWRYVTS